MCLFDASGDINDDDHLESVSEIISLFCVIFSTLVHACLCTNKLQLKYTLPIKVIFKESALHICIITSKKNSVFSCSTQRLPFSLLRVLQLILFD